MPVGERKSSADILKRLRMRLTGAVFLCALIVTGVLYQPALHGQFVFDDFGLPFQLTSGQLPLMDWLKGTRPVLMFTYWLNYQHSSSDPFGYHLLNLLIHALNGVLVFLVLSKLFAMARWPMRRGQ